MVEDRLYPCNINGKYYFEKVDIDELVKEQADNIIKALENKYEDETSNIYHNEEFKKYIESVKNGNIDAILNPSDPKFLKLFNVIVLEFGSYEFVERFLIMSDDETVRAYFEDLDSNVLNIQNAILQSNIDSISHLQKVYINFIENFAPQRLAHYTSKPINFDMLNGMHKIKKASVNYNLFVEIPEEPYIIELPSLADKLIQFNSLYSIESIMQVLELYRKYEREENKDAKLEIIKRIDSITIRGVRIQGNNRALINLTNASTNGTTEKMADSIVMRLKYYNNDERLDISDDFEQLLEKILEFKEENSLDKLYTDNIAFQKLLQMLKLGILPEKERMLLEDFLDNEFGRKDIDQSDLSKFDSKIESNEKFSVDEVREFYKLLMFATAKEGEMQLKYCEFFLTKIIEIDQEFQEGMNDTQRIIILEHFARLKSKQIAQSENYITFSNDFKSAMVGEYIDYGVIRIRPFYLKNQSLSIVLSMVTIFHELRNEAQEKSIASRKMDHLMYMMLKERIFRNVDIDYYSKDCGTMYEELDAEHFAIDRTLAFLKSLPFSEEFRQSNEWQEILRTLKVRLEDVNKGFKRAENKKEENGKLVNVEDAFEQLVFEKTEYIKEYPILKAEFNDDGIKKTAREIFEELIGFMKRKECSFQMYDLYKYILFSRAGRNFDECIELSDIEIPRDLNYVSRQLLEKLKYLVLENGVNAK